MRLEYTSYQLADRGIVKLRWEPRKNNVASTKNKEVYDQALVAMIGIPGSRHFASQLIEIKHADGTTTSYSDGKRPLVDAAGRDVIELFRSATPNERVGTDISVLDGISYEQIAHMNAAHIFTIEQLANLHDAGVSSLGLGALDLRRRANEWLKANENDPLRDELESLREELRQLREERQSPQRGAPVNIEAAKKKPGRKPRKPSYVESDDQAIAGAHAAA